MTWQSRRRRKEVVSTPPTEGTWNKHHRKPLCQGGEDVPGNIVWCKKYRHIAWNSLFNGKMSVQEIAHILNNYWIDPEYELVVQRR